MSRLTENEIAQLKSRLVDLGVSNAGLLDELVDHVAYDIELLMLEGLAFDPAIEAVLKKHKIIDLEPQQAETIRAISKRYRNQQLQYLIPVVFLLLGFSFRLFQFPLAGFLSYLSLTATALLMSKVGLAFFKHRKFVPLNLLLGVSISVSSYLLVFGSLSILGTQNLQPGTLVISWGISIYAGACLLYYCRAYLSETEANAKKRFLGLSLLSAVYVLVALHFIFRTYGFPVLNLDLLVESQLLGIAFLFLQILALLPVILWRGYYRNKHICLLLITGILVTFLTIPSFF